MEWLPWLVPALLTANGIFSFALGYRSKETLYIFAPQTSPETSRSVTKPAKPAERVLVRPDLSLFFENEALRDQLAATEACVADTEYALREAKAALARSESRILDAEKVKHPLTRSVFVSRPRQVGPR